MPVIVRWIITALAGFLIKRFTNRNVSTGKRSARGSKGSKGSKSSKASKRSTTAKASSMRVKPTPVARPRAR